VAWNQCPQRWWPSLNSRQGRSLPQNCHLLRALSAWLAFLGATDGRWGMGLDAQHGTAWHSRFTNKSGRQTYLWSKLLWKSFRKWRLLCVYPDGITSYINQISIFLAMKNRLRWSWSITRSELAKWVGHQDPAVLGTGGMLPVPHAPRQIWSAVEWDSCSAQHNDAKKASMILG
jgi:hypothetical protein